MTKNITIGLNIQDIQNAKKYFLNLKKNIPKMQNDILEVVANFIIERANKYISDTDLGSIVKNQLKTSWHHEKTANGIKIINNANVEKKVDNITQTVPIAILVEYGVGIVGEQNPHPNAEQSNYEYNAYSKRKNEDYSWSFWLNSNERDLPMNAFTDFGTFDDHRQGGKRMVVTTFGAKGVWYAYNALVDTQMEFNNPNGELMAAIDKVMERYLK